MIPRRGTASLALPLLAAACTLPLDEATHFRARLPTLLGQPVARLERELGPPTGDPVSTGSPRKWGETVFGALSGDCVIDAAVDPQDRIRSVTMTGDDYICGGLIAELHKLAPRYAADPTLAATEREESRRLLEKLVRARKALNQTRPRQ
jgi:hypothetical protein